MQRLSTGWFVRGKIDKYNEKFCQQADKRRQAKVAKKQKTQADKQ